MDYPFCNFRVKIAGEKLHENHVEQILHKVFEELKIEVSFCFLAPEITEKSSFYILFMQSVKAVDSLKLQKKLEEELCKNFHYKHCRTLHQLGEVEIQFLSEYSVSKFYEIIQGSSHLGSFKQIALRKETFWKTCLTS